MRVTKLLPALAVVAVLAGCGGTKAPDDPKQTLTDLVGHLADGDGGKACALLLPGARDTFARENEAADCEKAVAVISGRITDAKTYRAMVPAGLQVKGETATVSGYCHHGWKNADGSDSTLKVDPNTLGDITLKKTTDGWLVSDYSSSKHYSSCGG